MTARRITAAALRAAIRARMATPGAELAIVDAREEGEFGPRHLFWAAMLPLSRLEQRARALLPRQGVPVVVTDDAEGLAERAATRLLAMGYTDVAVLEGGVAAWEAAGGEVFSGVNVPSKAFGEWVEHAHATPSIGAAELLAMQRAGADMVILDSRPLDEFRRMTIPGAVNVPGGELAWRVSALAPRPETTVVVTCAGRTRSILGAESLRAAGVPNPVVALRNGTMGFELAGERCELGATRRFPPGTPPGAAGALAAARRLAARHGVGEVDRATLARWRAETGRTTYLLDVREESEFLAGHVPGSRHAPGGQLVQATDTWVAVLGARLVLIDHASSDGGGVRSRMAAQWLAQMGHRDVHVLDAAAGDLSDQGPAQDPCKEAEAIAADTIGPTQAAALLAAGAAVVVDLERSIGFRAGHIAGSLWGIRTRLAALRPHLAGRTVVIAAPETATARLAVPEVMALGAAACFVLAGGTAGWRAAGLPLVADRANPPDAACADRHLLPYERNDGVAEAMQAYLTWEIALPDQVARDDGIAFGPART